MCPILNSLQDKLITVTNRDSVKPIRLRDGHVVLYKRENNPVWQMRYKLYDRLWRRVSTRHRDRDYAIRAACDMYDEAKFRERLGLTVTTKKFSAIARVCLQDLSAEIAAGIKLDTNKDYIRIINKYLIPFFGSYHLENINGEVMTAYEQWRNHLMKRQPVSSTLSTHAGAYRRVINSAIQRGWLSDTVPIAQMRRVGHKGQARPAFTRAEVNQLLAFLESYSKGGHSQQARQMRLLLREYIELLLGTGLRCGRESMNIKWKHISWYTDNTTGKRYLRIWVSGKTGQRYLIAKHSLVTALTRLINNEPMLTGKTLDEVLAAQHDIYLFRLKDGSRPKSFHTTFRWLMLASNLLKEPTTNQNRTLYSLRHTYATRELLENHTDIHTLAKQMGTSIGMIEQHYSKLTATIAADRLA